MCLFISLSTLISMNIQQILMHLFTVCGSRPCWGVISSYRHYTIFIKFTKSPIIRHLTIWILNKKLWTYIWNLCAFRALEKFKARFVALKWDDRSLAKNPPIAFLHAQTIIQTHKPWLIRPYMISLVFASSSAWNLYSLSQIFTRLSPSVHWELASNFTYLEKISIVSLFKMVLIDPFFPTKFFFTIFSVWNYIIMYLYQFLVKNTPSWKRLFSSYHWNPGAWNST